MTLRLTVLGCSGSYASPGGACSGYLVSDGTTTIWVDAGPGTLANLQLHVAPEAVDAVVLSHEHPDHWTDLEGFLNVCRFVTGRRDIPVFAPAGLRDRTYDDTEPFLAWQEVADGGHASVGGLSLGFSRTDHGPETLAVRVDGGGRSMAYSADTGPGWSVSALGPPVDLAVCEATLPAGHEGGLKHLTAAQAGASARAAGAGRLLLTHLWPTLDRERSREEGTAAFGAPVELAATNATYEA